MTQEDSTAIILAAGEGRRLEPLTNRRPKPMLPVVDKPLLEHVVEAVSAAGINEIVLVVGYERDRIQTHFGDGNKWDVSISYAIQDKQLGTAHAVQQAEQHVDGAFLVLNGDRIIEPSVVSEVQAAINQDIGAAMAITRVAASETYGVVTLDDDRIVDIIEKPADTPQSEIINAGVYGFTPDVFDAIRAVLPDADGEYGLTAAIKRLAEDRTVQPIRYDGWWLDVTYPWDLLSVTGQVLDRYGGTTSGTVASGAQVAERAYLAGTASVGGNAVVGRGCSIGANTRIESNVTIERSVIFPDATIGPGTVLKDCIVGENATVGPNVTVTGGETTVIIGDEVHTGVDFGGVIGDNAAVGGAAVLEPGTILGDEVVVGDGAVARGTVSDGVEIRRG